MVPSDKGYDPLVHLSVGDVKVDNRAKPAYLEVSIKASKTDIFRKGVSDGQKFVPSSGHSEVHGEPKVSQSFPLRAILCVQRR